MYIELIYGIIVCILSSLGATYFGDRITFTSFFVDTFLNAHNYGFNSAMWFLSALFLVECLYVIFCKVLKNNLRNDTLLLILFSILNVASVYISRNMYELNNVRYIHILKCVYFIVFFHLGYLYRVYFECRDTFTSYKLVIPLAINMSIAAFFCGNTQDLSRIELLYYDSSWMIFTNSNIWVQLVTSITGIYFWLKVAEIISKSISYNDFIVKIGQNTFGIMTHHIFCFWLINSFIYYILGYQRFNYDMYMHDVWYKVTDYWPFSNMIYLFGSIIGSICISHIWIYIKNKLNVN